jgi:hypothetical protein
MKNSIVCLSARQWAEVSGILQNLPIDTPTYELTISKRDEKEFAIQFKNLNCIIEKSKPKKINPIGLHDLFW